MKKIILLSLLGLIFQVGCKPLKNDSDGKLQVSLAPEAPYVLEIPMRSCKQEVEGDGDEGPIIPSPSFQYTRFSYLWKGTSPLEIVFLRLDFESPDLQNGTFTCTLSDVELKRTLQPSLMTLTGSGDNSVVQSAGCSVRCGGIQVKSTVGFSVIPGKATLYAVETSDGETLPVSSQVDVFLTYSKTGL
jgi:hypothetical protein